MRTALDCIPCFARQTLQAARFVTDDVCEQEAIVREALRMMADMDLGEPPPVIVQKLHRHLRELTGREDPYRETKERLNRLAVEMLPELERRVQRAADPLAVALRYAIAGNVIDLGAYAGASTDELLSSLDATLDQPFHGDVELLRRAVASANTILYLADNAGEIVFDRLLLMQLPAGRVTVAVRGGPVINDVTLRDAREVGIHELAELMDNGSDAPGTLLPDCSSSFLERFHGADLVISKGQGNFETLNDVAAPIFFLFQVKCALASAHAGLPVGTRALIPSAHRPTSASPAAPTR